MASKLNIWSNPIHFVACGFGVGAIPWAPGTFGTLAAIPFYLLMAKGSFTIYCLLTIAYCAVSMYTTHITCEDIGIHDHPSTVSDEFAGFFVTMLGIAPSFWAILIGFVLFRIFDIFKPWPISWLDQHVHGGVGVVIDDVAAGLCSCIILHALFWLWG
jgi:phosphatidylglycerophosphatase A